MPRVAAVVVKEFLLRAFFILQSLGVPEYLAVWVNYGIGGWSLWSWSWADNK